MSLRTKGGILPSWLLGVMVAVAAHGQEEARDTDPGTISGWNPNACRPMTIAMGEFSGWGGDVEGFLGEDLIIRDAQRWNQFWLRHTRNVSPPPDRPAIDFEQQVVVAAIQGGQSSGGGPNITIASLRRSLATTSDTVPPVTIVIVDDERPGPLDVITNPFHIVVVPRTCLPPGASVSFRHVTPRRETAMVRGHAFVPANAADWRPAPGAVVRLARSNDDRQIAIAGLDGSFFFLNVRPGTYQLSAELPPYTMDPITVTLLADEVFWRNLLLRPGP